jgi:2'-5' RNA ligase
VPFLLLETMPYEIRESSKGYYVHKQGDSGPALGCHKSEAEARQQVKALYSSETIKEHTGVMIALPVPRDALPLIAALQSHLQGMADVEIVPLDEAHVTLLYLGDSSEIEGLKTRIYAGSLSAVEWQEGIPARLTGLARFNGDEGGRNPLVLLVDSPLLPGFRERVFSGIAQRGIPDNQRHGFIPHITLGYIPIAVPTPQIEVPQAKIVFDSFVVAWGDEQLIVPLSGETVKADGKGYGARAGETIRGNLTRGGDGKFASAGDSAPAAEEEKLPPRRQKLGRSAAARAERKRKVAEAKRQSAEAKRQARTAATEQRKRERAARREAEKKRRAEEAQRKLEANRKEALAKTPLNQAAYDALLAFSQAGDVDEDMARAIAQETGLLTIGSNGELRMNAEGRAFLKALDKGDARAALDAMSRASDRLDREEDKRERDSEKPALKHGNHNQAMHGRRYSSTRKQLRAAALESAESAANKLTGWDDPSTTSWMGTREDFIRDRSRQIYRESLAQRRPKLTVADLSSDDKLYLARIASRESWGATANAHSLGSATYELLRGMAQRGLLQITPGSSAYGPSQFSLTDSGRALLGRLVR